MGHAIAEELQSSVNLTHDGLAQDVAAREESALRRAVNAVKGWNHRRAATRHLTQMNDHMLADIGLKRHEIRHAAGGGSFILGALFTSLAELARIAVEILEARHQRRKSYRQLTRLDDHMLADIGLKRHEIEAAFHGKFSRPARRAAISVDTLRSLALPGFATNQDSDRRAA